MSAAVVLIGLFTLNGFHRDAIRPETCDSGTSCVAVQPNVEGAQCYNSVLRISDKLPLNSVADRDSIVDILKIAGSTSRKGTGSILYGFVYITRAGNAFVGNARGYTGKFWDDAAATIPGLAFLDGSEGYGAFVGVDRASIEKLNAVRPIESPGSHTAVAECFSSTSPA